MYDLLEIVGCVVLVAGTMAALFTASVIYVILKQGVMLLAPVLWRSAHRSRCFLRRFAGLAWEQVSQLLKGWGTLVTVRTRSTGKAEPTNV